MELFEVSYQNNHSRMRPAFLLGAAAPENDAFKAHQEALSIFVTNSLQEKSKTKKQPKPLRYDESDALHGFTMFHGNCEKSIGSLDTMAQAAVCDQDHVPTEAYVLIEDDGTCIQGVGGKITPAGKLYGLEVSLRIGHPPVILKFRIAPLSTPGLRFLWDYEQIRDTLGAILDPVRSIIHAEKIGISFMTEPIQILHRRATRPPIRTLGACGGMATDLLGMLEMGINVTEHVIIESDRTAVLIAKVALAKTGIKLTVIDGILNAHGPKIGKIDHATFMPKCGCWIRNCDGTEPKGFAHPDAEEFRQCGRLRSELLLINPAMSSVFVASKIHPTLKLDQKAQEEIAKSKFILLNASKVKSPSNDLKRFAADNLYVRFFKSDFAPNCDPNRFVNPGWRSERSPTRDPVFLHEADAKDVILDGVHHPGHTTRGVLPDEADALSGLAPGYSNAFGAVKVSNTDRLNLTRLGLNQFHARVMFRYVNMVQATQYGDLANIMHIRAPSRESHPETLELHLINLTHAEKVQHIRKELEGFQKPKLKITSKDPNQLPYHTRIVPEVKKSLSKSVMKKLAKMCNQKRIRMVDKLTEKQWLSPAFCKEKTGRVDADNDPLIRMLCDCIVVNGVTMTESWWLEFVTKIEDFKAEFSSKDKYFAVLDLVDAFEMMEVELESQKYLCFVIKVDGKIVVFQAMVCIQGLALSAYFFPIWWHRLCWAAFGFAHSIWWAPYCDDNVIKAPTNQRAQGRVDIFRALCDAADIGISPKTPGDVRTEVVGAGISISAKGLRADSTVEEALRMRLDVKVRGVKQARNLRGVVESARTAFHFDVGQQHVYAELMQPIHNAIARADRDSKFPTNEWIDKVEPAIEKLKGFVKIAHRAHIHPDSLITDDSSIVFYGDSSDDAAGVGVYNVRIPDARDVKIPEDLQDAAISTMVMCFARAHTPDKVDWLTYQNETELMVEAVEKLGKRITAALLKYDLNNTEICKVGVYTDSSTGRSIAQGLNNPASKPEHHTAMSRKWLNWSSRTYYTRFWNAHFGYCEGIKNDFSDWLSHIGHLLKDAGKQKSLRAQEKKPSKTEHIVKQVQEAKQLKPEFEVPPGWTFKDSVLKFSPEDWSAMSRATAIDDSSLFHKVTVSEILGTLTGTGNVSNLAKDRTNSWKQKIFAVCPEGANTPVLMVPRTMSRNEADIFSGNGFDEDLDMDTIDQFKQLVTLIPSNLACRVSTITQLDGEPEPDLRHDILLLFHEFAAHQNETYMYDQITDFAWWPSLKTDIKNHIKYCSCCMAKQHARRTAGIGTVITVRFRHLSGDHAILPKWMQDLTGYYSIFTMVDLASGDFMLVASKTNTPEEAIAAIFNHWVRHRGLFYTFTSDQGSIFTSKVIALFQKLIGVKLHRFTAVHDSRGAAMVESKNKVVRDMQHEVSESSNIRCAEDLEFFITQYMLKTKQVRKTAGSTLFERIHGIPAITIGDLLTKSPDINADLEKVNKSQCDFVEKIAQITKGMMDDYHMERQVRARDNAYTRDAHAAQTRGIDQQFEEGQILSLHGKKVKVINLRGYDGINHLIADVREEGTERLIPVRCEDLRERCWGQPQWNPMQNMKCSTGDFVVFDIQGSANMRAGIVMEVTETEVSVHEYAQNIKRSRWLPLWCKPSVKDKAQKDCPSGYTSLIVAVKPGEIVLVGKLAGMILSDDTKRRAVAQGFDWVLPLTASQIASGEQ